MIDIINIINYCKYPYITINDIDIEYVKNNIEEIVIYREDISENCDNEEYIQGIFRIKGKYIGFFNYWTRCKKSDIEIFDNYDELFKNIKKIILSIIDK